MRTLVAVAILAAGLPLAAQAPRMQTKAAPSKSAAAKPAGPKKEMAVPFKTGETLDYDIGWSSFVTAGTAEIVVKEKKASYNSTAYYIVAEGRPTTIVAKLYTLYYKADTLLDVFSMLPQRGSLYSEEGKRHRMKTTTFDQAAKKATFEVETRTTVKKDFAIPGFTQDALSAIYVLRSIPFKAGEKFNMPVSDNGQIYRVQMQVGAVEPVKTGIGTVNGLKITPVITGPDKDAPHGLALWISDDARRLPLRMEAQLLVGKFVITLSKASGL
jgi:Protein of unknown function (DUF3108)